MRFISWQEDCDDDGTSLKEGMVGIFRQSRQIDLENKVTRNRLQNSFDPKPRLKRKDGSVVSTPTAFDLPSKTTYRQQLEDVLRRLGFETYEDYLSSPLWHKIRHRVMLRDEFACQSPWHNKLSFKLPKLEVHHKIYDYDTMSGNILNGLVTICRACHEYEHGIVR